MFAFELQKNMTGKHETVAQGKYLKYVSPSRRDDRFVETVSMYACDAVNFNECTRCCVKPKKLSGPLRKVNPPRTPEYPFHYRAR